MFSDWKPFALLSLRFQFVVKVSFLTGREENELLFFFNSIPLVILTFTGSVFYTFLKSDSKNTKAISWEKF